MPSNPPVDNANRVAAIQKRLASRWGPRVNYTRQGITRLCIDGPPRSANSLLCHKVHLSGRDLAGKPGTLAHHTHDVDSVLLAILLEVPVIMPLREPVASLSSYYVYRAGQDMGAACALYARMCQIALNHRQEVLVAPFEVTISDVNTVFRQANARFGIQLPMLPMSDEEANAVIADKVRAANRHGDRAQARVGVPDERRDAAKSKALAVLQAVPDFNRCRLLYERLMGQSPAAAA